MLGRNYTEEGWLAEFITCLNYLNGIELKEIDCMKQLRSTVFEFVNIRRHLIIEAAEKINFGGRLESEEYKGLGVALDYMIEENLKSRKEGKAYKHTLLEHVTEFNQLANLLLSLVSCLARCI